MLSPALLSARMQRNRERSQLHTHLPAQAAHPAHLSFCIVHSPTLNAHFAALGRLWLADLLRRKRGILSMPQIGILECPRCFMLPTRHQNTFRSAAISLKRDHRYRLQYSTCSLGQFSGRVVPLQTSDRYALEQVPVPDDTERHL